LHISLLIRHSQEVFALSKACYTLLCCLGGWLITAALAQERPAPTLNPAVRVAVPPSTRGADQTRPSPSPTRSIRSRPDILGPALERIFSERIQPRLEYEIPNVVNSTVAQARRVVIRRGFQFAVAARAASSADDAVVIGQSPAANTKARRGAKVEVFTRPPTTTQTNLVPVPNVVGVPLERARSLLNPYKFRMEFLNQPSNETAVIASQRPAAGEMVPPGSTVYVAWQTATTTTPTPEYTTVPLVIGMSLNDARMLLRSHRLGWDIANPPVTGADKVSAQGPAPRTRVLLGTRVRLTALKAPASPSPTATISPTPIVLARVPNVTGMTLRSARNVLSYEQFRPVVRNAAPVQDTSLVIEQNPTANTMARPQSTVTLTLEIPPSPTPTPTPVVTTTATPTVTPTPDFVTVPDLQKQLLPEAVKTLQAARLTLGELLPSESAEAFDTVLEQTPAAGEQVPANSSITLVVARPLKVLPAPPTVMPTPSPEAKEGVWEQIKGLPLFAALSLLALAGAWAFKKLRGLGGNKPPEPPRPAANVQVVPVLDRGVQTLSAHKPFAIRRELRWLPHVDDGEQTLRPAPGGLIAAERKVHEQE
jgi:beta-lactam-binding protein with PASTA domain